MPDCPFMPSRFAAWQRARRKLVALDDPALDLEALIVAAGGAVACAVPYDSACWHTLDPTTLIETTSYLENMGANGRGASAIEYLHDDFNKFAVLARSASHSGILSEATRGDVNRSLRYREILQPNGLRSELRASFVADGACWGSFGLFREAPADFDREEAEFVHTVTATLGRAFRSALFGRTNGMNGTSGTGGGGDAPGGPGLVLFDGRRRVEAMTPAAREWLAQLGWDGDPDELPYVLYTVADETRRLGKTGDEGAAATRIPGSGGTWIALHGSTAAGTAPDRVAVILDECKLSSLAPLIARAYGLSKREREVTELVLQGASTAQVAERLVISPYTVQEHLKVIFAKTGVHSRRELIARVFAHPYRPPIHDKAPV